MDTSQSTFVIDCCFCNAKVAAIEKGRAEHQEWIDEIDEPWGHRLLIGVCPKCKSLLVGEAKQIDFEGHNADTNGWSDVIRVFPKSPKVFFSQRIPKVVEDSLLEADRCLQAGANIAACVMLGRALEAVCRNVLDAAAVPDLTSTTLKSNKDIYLGPGIKKLLDQKIIDDRLYAWSQQLQAFRNLAAHPDPESMAITREDAFDLQTFVSAIVEYIYDLTDRYEEFKRRNDARVKRKSP